MAGLRLDYDIQEAVDQQPFWIWQTARTQPAIRQKVLMHLGHGPVRHNLASGPGWHAVGWRIRYAVRDQALGEFPPAQAAEKVVLPEHLAEFCGTDDADRRMHGL